MYGQQSSLLPTRKPRRARPPKPHQLYSPRIPDELIHCLYIQGQREGRPMTHLVKDAIISYLSAHQVEEEEGGTSSQ